jgi:hypothetical protein
MHDEVRRREARMMEGVAGMCGRNASATEVDMRLGLAPAGAGPAAEWPGRARRLVRRLVAAVFLRPRAGAPVSPRG